MIPIADNPGRRVIFPYVNLGIILLNILVFLYQVSLPEPQLERFIDRYAIIPAELVRNLNSPSELLTVFTAMFMHGGLLHLGGNMVYLWVFGDNVEDAMGHVGYLIFYLLCGIAATVAQVVVTPNSLVPNVGASGAIAGILGAYLVLFPHSGVRTIVLLGPFILLPTIGAVFLIGFWALLQFLSGFASFGMVSEGGGIAYFAHIGGFIAGLILARPFARYLDRARQIMPYYREYSGR